jgi:hypothetical protein
MHHRPEKDPLPGHESVTDRVIQDLLLRQEAGVKKYKGPLKTHNGRRPLVDLYQELLDASLYAKQELLERKDIYRVIFSLVSLVEMYERRTTAGLIKISAQIALDEARRILASLEAQNGAV